MVVGAAAATGYLATRTAKAQEMPTDTGEEGRAS